MLPVFVLFLPITLATNFKFEEHKNYDKLPMDICGENMADRIIGGTKASLGQFPWMVRIGYALCEDSVAYRCGGALITESVLVTAAHCVTNLPSLQCSDNNSAKLVLEDVILGEHLTESDPDCEKDVCADPVQTIQISKVLPHPSYNDPKLRHDIALVFLETPANITEWVTPICLLKDNQVDDYVNSTGTVAGWGVTDIFTEDTANELQYLNVPVTEQEKCLDTYQKLSPLSDESQLCAGGIEGKDSCSGDSGGPLMVITETDSGPKYGLLGAVSFGYKKCGFSPVPAVYTFVPFYHEWILDNI